MMELSELKSVYEDMAKKHGLPSFEKMNIIFEIERIEKESDMILRQVRKAMMDRIISYTRFIEMLLNPSQAPFSYMSLARDMSSDDRALLNKVYRNFVDLELRSLKEEIEYDESAEARIIIDIYEAWGKTKDDLKKIINSLGMSWNVEKAQKKDKSYFG